MEKATFGARYFSTAGMIGCFMSHLRIWERVVKEDHEAVVVLEDDVVLNPNFNERLGPLFDELPLDWDICLLGAVGCIQTEVEPLPMKIYGLMVGGHRSSPGKTRSVSDHLYVPYKPAGTHAYMVSKRGAKKLLTKFPKARYHVDLTAWSLKELRLFAAKDFLAMQRSGERTTVSKEGDPMTKRYLSWMLEASGFAAMARRGGVPDMNWAWKTAIFAVPVPFTSGRKKIVAEMGPSSSVFVGLLMMSAICRRRQLVGMAFLYLASCSCLIRWLAGTTSKRMTAMLLSIAGVCFFYP